MSFTKTLDIPSDKTTASHLIHSLKTIEMPIFALNCVDFTMNQDPCKLSFRQIQRKRKLTLNQVGSRIVLPQNPFIILRRFPTQPFKTLTKRFFKFTTLAFNLRKRSRLQNKPSRIWVRSNSRIFLNSVTKRWHTLSKKSISNSAQLTMTLFKNKLSRFKKLRNRQTSRLPSKSKNCKPWTIK